MKDFVITCSSTCDLTPFYLRKHNMYYVSYYYYLDNDKFFDDFYREHTVEDFYTKLKTSDSKTSQPDPEQYKNLWIKLIEQGNDILHIEMDSAISGAINSALIAKSMVEDEIKDAKIYVVDSLIASCGYGLLLDKVYDFKLKCNDIDKTYEYVNELKNNINVVFLVPNLEQLIKGGRLSKVAGGVAKILNIIPILHVCKDGKLESIKKARGINNAMDEIINLMKENIHSDDKVIISHTNCIDAAKTMCEKIKTNFNNIVFPDEYITNVGTVIGTHLGQGAVVISYVGDGRI